MYKLGCDMFFVVILYLILFFDYEIYIYMFIDMFFVGFFLGFFCDSWMSISFQDSVYYFLDIDFDVSYVIMVIIFLDIVERYYNLN